MLSGQRAEPLDIIGEAGLGGGVPACPQDFGSFSWLIDEVLFRFKWIVIFLNQHNLRTVFKFSSRLEKVEQNKKYITNMCYRKILPVGWAFINSQTYSSTRQFVLGRKVENCDLRSTITSFVISTEINIKDMTMAVTGFPAVQNCLCYICSRDVLRSF